MKKVFLLSVSLLFVPCMLAVSTMELVHQVKIVAESKYNCNSSEFKKAVDESKKELIHQLMRCGCAKPKPPVVPPVQPVRDVEVDNCSRCGCAKPKPPVIPPVQPVKDVVVDDSSRCGCTKPKPPVVPPVQPTRDVENDCLDLSKYVSSESYEELKDVTKNFDPQNSDFEVTPALEVALQGFDNAVKAWKKQPEYVHYVDVKRTCVEMVKAYASETKVEVDKVVESLVDVEQSVLDTLSSLKDKIVG